VTSHNPATDIALFQRVKDRNDYQALKILFARYYPGMCDFVNYLVKNPQIAEELIADVFIKLWEKRSTLEIRTSFRAYLYASAKNEALAYLGRSQSRFSAWVDLSEVDATDPITPEQRIITREALHTIDAAISRLPEQCQLIFRLHKLDGLSYKEIAEALHLSVKTVENQMGKALKELRISLPISDFTINPDHI
jgi:RNA polymerase sigma-70 factor, ECF subfamily